MECVIEMIEIKCKHIEKDKYGQLICTKNMLMFGVCELCEFNTEKTSGVNERSSKNP